MTCITRLRLYAQFYAPAPHADKRPAAHEGRAVTPARRTGDTLDARAGAGMV